MVTGVCFVSVDGNWGEWSDYSACPVTCGGGLQDRSRQCDSPLPQYGGAYCEGIGEEIRVCGPESCPGQ